MTVTIKRRHAEIALFGLFLVLALLAFLHTAGFPAPLLRGYPGAAMFPRLILLAMAFFCLLGLARSLTFALRKVPETGAPIEIEAGAFAGALAWVGGCLALLVTVGMEAAVLALVGGGLWARTGRPLIALTAGVLSVAVVYLLFVQALSVGLPLAVLPRYPGLF